jgi:SAM-dependent methyltransferase
VVFWDIRPPNFRLPNLEYRNGSILEIPLPGRSVISLSCLHTIEHIGLGRYGDPIDPQGTDKAVRELARILAPGGRLLLSCPIGRERVCFNAHRILHPERVIQLLPELSLKEFSAVGDPDNGSHHFFRDATPKDFAKADEALGLYVFVRPA